MHRYINHNPAIHQYSEVFLAHLGKDEAICSNQNRNHCIKYVCSGELILKEDDMEYILHKGECAFIRRDHKTTILKHSFGNEEFKGITMIFYRDFLRNLYADTSNMRFGLSDGLDSFKESVIRLDDNTAIESLFKSILPYFEKGTEPTKEIMDLKMQEGILALLQSDDRFFPILFDFKQPWKIDLVTFMENNFMYDFTLKEFAEYTGRSPSSFKRDFQLISTLPPMKWILKKRLALAYDLLLSGNHSVREICHKVGFKNQKHFATSFKREYGVVPSSILCKQYNN